MRALAGLDMPDLRKDSFQRVKPPSGMGCSRLSIAAPNTLGVESRLQRLELLTQGLARELDFRPACLCCGAGVRLACLTPSNERLQAQLRTAFAKTKRTERPPNVNLFPLHETYDIVAVRIGYDDLVRDQDDDIAFQQDAIERRAPCGFCAGAAQKRF